MKQFISKHKVLSVIIGLIIIALLYTAVDEIYLFFHFSLTVEDVSVLSQITGRDYTGAEITDIKTKKTYFGDLRGTDIYVFLKEDAVFDSNPDYEDMYYKDPQYADTMKSSLDQFGHYFFEELADVGVKREHLLSCGTHFKTIEIRHGWTQQSILWMPLSESYDGYSNVLICTNMPDWIVSIDHEKLIGKY